MPDADPATAAEAESGTSPDEPAEGAAPSDGEPAGAEAAEEKPADPVTPVSGTVPAWWTWVGRHRKPVSLVALAVVVAVMGTVVAVSVTAQTPKDVVESYLDAIRSGDTQAALEIAGEPDGEDDERLRFLSADALADDWTVDAIAERNVRENEADVDVTIRTGEISQQGRFHMVKGDDGWTMESPFVNVDLAVGGLDIVEIGDVRLPAEQDETTRAVPLLLFPGVYELYPSLENRIRFDEPLIVAAPGGTNAPVQRFTAEYTLTEAATAAAQNAVDASVDTCAAQSTVRPPGCPFDVSETAPIWSFTGVDDVAWTVVTHPEAHFAVTRNGGGLDLVLRKPGTVKVTGTGVPEDGGARTPFTLTCEFGLDNLTIDVPIDGVEIGNTTDDDYSAALATVCF